jgi:hypothetical protein
MLFINYCKGMDVDRLRNISIDGKMMSSVEIRDAMIFGYHILLTGIQEKL